MPIFASIRHGPIDVVAAINFDGNLMPGAAKSAMWFPMGYCRLNRSGIFNEVEDSTEVDGPRAARSAPGQSHLPCELSA